MLFTKFFVSLAVAHLVTGHGVITKVVGNMGGTGFALGVVSSTPRDGKREDPFQLDSTVFDGDNADACGETPSGGPNIFNEQITKVVFENNGLPKVSPGGLLYMTLHQVNGDGAGPYECFIDSSGTGTGGWTKIDVINNVPGRKSRSKASATDFPLITMIPEKQICTGSAAGKDNLCMVRCNNAASQGPFGGCVPITMVSTGDVAKINKIMETGEEFEERASTKNDPDREKELSPRREIPRGIEPAGTVVEKRASGKLAAVREHEFHSGKEAAGDNNKNPIRKARNFHS